LKNIAEHIIGTINISVEKYCALSAFLFKVTSKHTIPKFILPGQNKMLPQSKIQSNNADRAQ